MSQRNRFYQYAIQLYDPRKQKWVYSMDIRENVHPDMSDDGYYESKAEGIVNFMQINKALQRSRYTKSRLIKEIFQQCDDGTYQPVSASLMKEHHFNR